MGMKLHKAAIPQPPKPDFERVFKTTISPRQGEVRIQFYLPKRWKDRGRSDQPKFPVVVNFHGGGFTLGQATDDARWAHAVNKHVDAVVAAVDYRLGPEEPFPTAVEDGTDAVLYVAKHAEELHIDVNKIAICGFSSGGNMAFTVPMRLRAQNLPSSAEDAIGEQKVMKASAEDVDAATDLTDPVVEIAAVLSWYPSCDYTLTRAERHEKCLNKEKDLSPMFFNLFDESYIATSGTDLSSPYLSPAVAPVKMLESLPHEIILYTCEWCSLRAEAEGLKTRLEGLGKNVKYTCIPKVPHGFDRAPNPLGISGVKTHYKEACAELRRIFDAR